jgi:hypothetical protein
MARRLGACHALLIVLEPTEIGEITPQAGSSVATRLMSRSRVRVVWSNPGNPPDSVAQALGIAPRHFSRALHKIKAANDFSSMDHVIIYSDGRVTDEQGEPLVSLNDED